MPRRTTHRRSSRRNGQPRRRSQLGERLTKALILGGAFACLWYDTNLHTKLLQWRRQTGTLTVFKPVESTKPTLLTRGYNATSPLRIAFVGNSILYYNDCPGLLLAMMTTAEIYYVQAEACLKSGSSLSNIHQWGCEPHRRFDKSRALTMDVLLNGQEWDFVIMQDQTTVPSVPAMRRDSLKALEQDFVPPLRKAGATPVFLQTAGYAPPRQDVQLFEPMTTRLSEGYHAYADLMTQQLAPMQARMAPAGDAFAHIYPSSLWPKLYADDGTHPSAHGTFLQACVLYMTLVGKEPPLYNSDWWLGRRTGFKWPTPEEAEELRQVAIAVVKAEWERKDAAAKEGR